MEKDEAKALLINMAAKYVLKMLPQQAIELLEEDINLAHQTLANSPYLNKWQDKVVILEHWEGVLEEVAKSEKEQLIEKIKTAVFSEKKVSFSYQGKKAAEYNPIGIIARDKHIYLVASYWNHSEAFLFSVRNISEFVILNQPSIQPKHEFSLKDYAEEKLNFFNPDNTIDHLIVEFPLDVWSYVKNNYPEAEKVHFDRKNASHGHFRFVASKININAKLLQWLKGFDNKVQVIEPLEVRKKVNNADLDKLTNLYNRQMFDRILYREIEGYQRDSRHRFCILMMDIDHFKKINDTYGHVFGDTVIQAFAHCLRAYDGIRYGGEEFCVFLSQTSSQEALEIGERIRTKIEQLELVQNIEYDEKVKFTTSIGIAEFPLHLDNELKDFLKVKNNKPIIKDEVSVVMKNIIEKADKALYQAKSGGRNQCVLYKT